ncbi:MAG: transcriptional regulator [Polynucleobacter sp.]|jgi:y4mF family transcriptional regulator|nr:transcriptional regulator [Polynucleobacter sp.]
MGGHPLSTPSTPVHSTRDLGLLLKHFRGTLDLTQADISGLANTGNRFVIELERGKETVQLNKVFDVLEVLGLEMVIQPKRSF